MQTPRAHRRANGIKLKGGLKKGHFLLKKVIISFDCFLPFRYISCMENEYYKKLNGELQRLENLRTNISRRLDELNEYSSLILRPYKVREHTYYYAKKRGQAEAWYLGSESDDIVIKTKEYRYLKQMLVDVESEIELTKTVISSHRALGYEAINKRLPKAYRNARNITIPSVSEAAVEWKRRMEAEKAKYPIKRPEELTQTAIDGTKTRSKSEMSIANLFATNGIPYVYELPHYINGVLIYSDFTALSLQDCKTEKILEHEGLMNDPGYQRVFLSKTNSYLAAGLIPGRDVFFTFEDLKGGFDISPVMDIIETNLKPRS